MKLIPIFVAENSEDGLWAMYFKGKYRNEFDQFFDLMNDNEWLQNFFANNKADLESGFWDSMTVEDAMVRTIDEVAEMEHTLYRHAKEGFMDGSVNLQQLFKPLNNNEYSIITHQKSKARIRSSWLRVYAIRINKNCYVVTGGAIKLTKDMKRMHLESELKKLEKAKIFLRDRGIDFSENLNTWEDE